MIFMLLVIFNFDKVSFRLAFEYILMLLKRLKLVKSYDFDFISVSLRLVTDLIIFGGDIILTCTVHGIRELDSDVTRQWSMGNHDQLLSYNGRINNHRKYKETIFHGNAFSLKILNVTVKDVNVTYRCRYGFDTATYFIKICERASIAETQKDKGNLTRNNTIFFTGKLKIIYSFHSFTIGGFKRPFWARALFCD